MTIACFRPPPPKLASPHRSSTAGYFPRYFRYFFSCLANEFSPGFAAPSPVSALFAFTIFATLGCSSTAGYSFDKVIVGQQPPSVEGNGPNETDSRNDILN